MNIDLVFNFVTYKLIKSEEIEQIYDAFIKESRYSLNCKLDMCNWVSVDDTRDQR